MLDMPNQSRKTTTMTTDDLSVHRYNTCSRWKTRYSQCTGHNTSQPTSTTSSNNGTTVSWRIISRHTDLPLNSASSKPSVALTKIRAHSRPMDSCAVREPPTHQQRQAHIQHNQQVLTHQQSSRYKMATPFPLPPQTRLQRYHLQTPPQQENPIQRAIRHVQQALSFNHRRNPLAIIPTPQAQTLPVIHPLTQTITLPTTPALHTTQPNHHPKHSRWRPSGQDRRTFLSYFQKPP